MNSNLTEPGSYFSENCWNYLLLMLFSAILISVLCLRINRVWIMKILALSGTKTNYLKISSCHVLSGARFGRLSGFHSLANMLQELPENESYSSEFCQQKEQVYISLLYNAPET